MHNILLLKIGVLLVSLAPLFAKGIDLSPVEIIWWRCFFTFLLLGSFLFVLRKYKIPSKKLLPAALTGIFLGLHWWTYFESIQVSTIAIGVLTLFTFPLITALLEPLFLKTKFSLRQILGGLGIVGGVYFLLPEFSLENTTTQGVLWGLLSAFVYSLRNIFTKKYLSHLDAMPVFNIQIFSALLLISFPLFLSVEFVMPSLENLGLIILLSVVCTIGGHGLLVYSLKHFSASTVGIINSPQVIYAAVLGFLFFAELPQPSFYIGATIILGVSIYEILPQRGNNDKK